MFCGNDQQTHIQTRLSRSSSKSVHPNQSFALDSCIWAPCVTAEAEIVLKCDLYISVLSCGSTAVD